MFGRDSIDLVRSGRKAVLFGRAALAGHGAFAADRRH
jgi:hypothetical protein